MRAEVQLCQARFAESLYEMDISARRAPHLPMLGISHYSRTRGMPRITARETFACYVPRGIDIPDNDERDGNAESTRVPRKVGVSKPLAATRLERARFGGILDRI